MRHSIKALINPRGGEGRLIREGGLLEIRDVFKTY